MFDIQALLLHTAILQLTDINRFRSDSSLPPGDSHPFDVGLTSPTCRFPPDLFLCLGRRKRGVHPDAVAPRRPGLGRRAQRKPQSADASPRGQQHRQQRCWGARLGGMSKGLDGEVCEEKRKPVGDVVGPCVLVPSWWERCDCLNAIETIWTLSQLETFALHGLVTSDAN